jgi:hypothetical protein
MRATKRYRLCAFYWIAGIIGVGLDGFFFYSRRLHDIDGWFSFLPVAVYFQGFSLQVQNFLFSRPGYFFLLYVLILLSPDLWSVILLTTMFYSLL